MVETMRSTEISESKKPETNDFKQIKPESNMTVNDARSFVNDLFGETPDRTEGYYTTDADRLKHTPLNPSDRGEWNGPRGESEFTPSVDSESGKKAKEKLSEYEMDAITYEHSEPDFSKCSEATVEIENMTENRHDYSDANGDTQPGNFTQADEKCAGQWNETSRDGRTDWQASDVRDWRRENEYSWHECCDTKTMNLVSWDIHGYFIHSGGVAECKTRDAVDFGGEFDE